LGRKGKRGDPPVSNAGQGRRRPVGRNETSRLGTNNAGKRTSKKGKVLTKNRVLFVVVQKPIIFGSYNDSPGENRVGQRRAQKIRRGRHFPAVRRREEKTRRHGDEKKEKKTDKLTVILVGDDDAP